MAAPTLQKPETIGAATFLIPIKDLQTPFELTEVGYRLKRHKCSFPRLSSCALECGP